MKRSLPMTMANLKPHHRPLLLLAFGLAAFLPGQAKAALTIFVSDDTINDRVLFSWSGVIGDSGTDLTTTFTPTRDFIDPSNTNSDFAFNAADKSLYPGDSWTADRRYPGTTTSVWGTGSSITTFDVEGDGIPLSVYDDGTLRVGLANGSSTTVDLATATFSGSFSVPGSRASNGILDSLNVGDTQTLWTAASGSGLIRFQVVVPEPSTALLAALGCLALLRRRAR